MIAYFQGEFLPLEQCHISPLDRSFLFGDCVYEVLSVYQGKAFMCDEHIARIDYSLKQVDIKNPHTPAQWRQLIAELIEHTTASSGNKPFSIYLHVSRGMAARNHAPNEAMEPIVFMMTMEEKQDPSLSQGVSVITTEDIRWQRCDIKSTNLLANVLMRRLAQQQGCYEACAIKEGYLTEGAASNVFIAKDGVIRTPPLDHRILAGVTRQLVIDIAQRDDIACEEVPIKEEAIFSADEMWLSSSTKDLVPVTSVDQKVIGDGKPGQFWRHIDAAIKEMKVLQT